MRRLSVRKSLRSKAKSPAQRDSKDDETHEQCKSRLSGDDDFDNDDCFFDEVDGSEFDVESKRVSERRVSSLVLKFIESKYARMGREADAKEKCHEDGTPFADDSESESQNRSTSIHSSGFSHIDEVREQQKRLHNNPEVHRVSIWKT